MNDFKGPFRVEKKEGASFHRETGVKTEFTKFLIRNQEDIAVGLFSNEYSMSLEEASKLAHLFAAAPEMYEAIEFICQELYVSEIDGKKTTPNLGLIFNRAANILKKARGES